MSRVANLRLNLVLQVGFAIVFAGTIALSVSSCESRPAEAPLSETAHAHYHVHGPGIEHGHEHADFPSGGHAHGHAHSRDERLP